MSGLFRMVEVGPTALFDKSFLHSLSVDESVFHRLCKRSATNPYTLKVASLRRVASALGCEAMIVFVLMEAVSLAALAARTGPRRGYPAGWA